MKCKHVVAACPTGEDNSSFYLVYMNGLKYIEDETLEYTVIFKYCPMCGVKNQSLDN